ncbi:MFS transporter [Sphingomonas sp.]|uniref:MFS transporter n=1 Tax=Sphingomonas sp. TaxID=28214 RepID=UPI003B00903A
MSVALSTPPQRRLSGGIMSAYGLGSIAYGVKDQGFGTFLLLFYNLVLGVPAATVGFVVMCALVLDAFIDPAVGFLSDRTRSRWGRRHPWMYGSAVPIAVGYTALWSPPASLGETGLLVWLFVCAVIVRTAVSCYEVPSVALTPELSSDYDERTRIMAYRYLFGWAGGLGMMLAAYLSILAPVPAAAPRAAFATFGMVGAIVIAVAILVSAAGTHREIPNLPKPPAITGTLRESFAELFESIRNRAFAILMMAGLCAYTIQGIGYALSNYFYAFVWMLHGVQLVYLIFALMLGAATAFVIAPRVARGGSKAGWAVAFGLGAATVQTAPFWLRLAGLFPVPGTPAFFPLYFVVVAVGTACSVAGFILGASMMADVVEDSEAKTGRRSEGVFFAGSFFVQKCTSGIGIFLASIILAIADFPVGAKPGTVDVATIDRLTIVYASVYVGLALIGAFFFSRFPFGRAEHEARLGKLAGAPVVDAGPH